MLKNPKAGKYAFKATYAGDQFNLPSTADLVETLKNETKATLKSSADPSTQGHAVTFTVTVTSPDGIPSGDVTLKKNGAVVATNALSKGAASFSVDFHVDGTHKIVAVYLGNATFAASTSNDIAEVTKAAATTPKPPAPPAVQFITQPKSHLPGD